MDNKCIIFLPAAEPTGYAPGHFNRVYDYVIVPACRLGGFWPERIVGANEDIIKIIIESEMAICDLSSNNKDVLYAFAIRQALGLPAVLIKDSKTSLNFNGKGFDEVEYDDSLRIDTVQSATQVLSDALKTSNANKGEKNTVFNRLGIDFSKPVVVQELTFEPIPLSEAPEPKEPSLPVISPLPDYVGDPFNESEVEKVKVGDAIFHINHGKGEIKSLKTVSKDKMAGVQFETGLKILVLSVGGPFRKIIK